MHSSVKSLLPYQQRAIELIQNLRTVLVMPPGAGKTFTAESYVASVKPSSVLWIAHRQELLDQVQSPQIDRLTVQSLMRIPVPTKYDLLIWDECHHATAPEYSRISQHYKRILGLTATPERNNGTGLGSIFNSLVCPVSISELISLQRLVPVEVLAPSKYLPPGRVAQTPTASYVDHCKGEQAICYAPNIASSLQYAHDFNTANIPAAHLDGTTNSLERKRIINEFREGRIKVLVNSMLFTEGFDVPGVSVIILARGVSTQGAWIQTTLRGARAAPGKSRCLVLDLRGSVHIHGSPTEDRVYSLEGRGIRRKLDLGDQRYCSVCGAPWIAAACPECGYATAPPLPPKVTGAKLERKVYLPQATDEQKISRLRSLMAEAKAKKWKPSAVYVRYGILFGCQPTPEIRRRAYAK